MSEKIKVLIVDDALFMRKAITEIIESDPELEVVDTAKNGLVALEKIRLLKPDVITLDMDMPLMDGLTCIRHIMINCPVPIVVLSSMFGDGATTFDALRLGVVDFVPKPSGAVSRDIETAKKLIIDRIKIAAGVNMENIRRVRLEMIDPRWSSPKQGPDEVPHYILTLGTSLSGPNTVIRLISQLPSSLPTAVVVVQEISNHVLPSFTKKFNEHTAWQVNVVTDNLRLKPGTCYIHSNENSLLIESDAQGKPIMSIKEHRSKPLDHLFNSAVDVFGPYTIGMMLTGIGSDGADGFRKIRENSGFTIAQNQQCCVYPNLTDNVINQGLVDFVLDERQLPETIEKIVTDGVMAA
ncbi:MAG: response regulator [Desulfobacteraceae bacterium]|nr:response regulator [Desulfobacteraceae bacterium]